MIVTSFWWEKPEKYDIYVNEYQVYSVRSEKNTVSRKKRLLARSNYHFFQDSDEDLLQKCLLLIKDKDGETCFRKLYTQIDNENRRYFTTR